MGKGITGHESPNDGKTNEWYTPPYITDSVGHFDLDPCAAIDRKRDIAEKNYTILDDGLVQPWVGRVWLNPPYGRRTTSWLEKMSKHGNGVVLIFARTETKMFHEYIWPFASGILFMRGRIKFLNESGATMGGAGAPSCLISYDGPGNHSNQDSIKTCGLPGKFISLID